MYEHYLADGMAENAALMKSDSVDGSLDARPLETVETPPAIRPSALEQRSMLEPLEPPPPDKDGIWKVPLRKPQVCKYCTSVSSLLRN